MKTFLKKIRSDRDFRAVLIMSVSAIFNGVYGIFSFIVGLLSLDPYLISCGIYYFLLAMVEGILILRRKVTVSMRPYGFLLMALDLSLSLMTFYALFTGSVKAQNEIVMIAIATYSFLRIALAIKNFIDARRRSDVVLAIMRSISFSTALIGMLSLTMQMLVTFGGELDRKTVFLVGAVGLAVFIVNLLIAIYLVINKVDLFRKTKQKGV